MVADNDLNSDAEIDLNDSLWLRLFSDSDREILEDEEWLDGMM